MKYTNDAICKRKNRENKICRMVSIVIYMLLIPLIIYNISLIVQAIIKPEKTPSFLGIKTYVIISGSMEPEYNVGDIVIVKETDISKLKEGDVVSFRDNGDAIVTHRIIEEFEEKGEKRFKTKGDSNNTEDRGYRTENVIEGKVISSIPNVGKLAILLQDKIYLMLTIVLFYIYLIKCDKIKKRNERRKFKRIEYEKKILREEG